MELTFVWIETVALKSLLLSIRLHMVFNSRILIGTLARSVLMFTRTQPLDVSAVLVKLEADINKSCKFWIGILTNIQHVWNFVVHLKKISSEMEVAPRQVPHLTCLGTPAR